MNLRKKIRIIVLNNCKICGLVLVLLFLSLTSLLSENHFAGNESQITNSNFPESEAYLSINPVDQNNLAFISIQHRNTQNRDNYLSPIHYSTNRGASWHLSNFQFIPEQKYFLLAEASTPVVCFSSDGIVVAAVIYTLFDKISDDTTEVTQLIIWVKSNSGGKSWEYPKNKILAYHKSTFNNSPNFGLAKVFSGLNIESTSSNKLIISTVENSTRDESLSILRLFEIDLKKDEVAELESKIIGDANEEINYFHAYYSGDLLHFVFVEQDEIYSNYYLNYSLETQKYSDKVKISDYYFKDSKLEDDYFPSKFNAHPSIFSDKSSPAIYCTWNSSGINELSNNQKIYLSHSEDMGQSWTDPEQISPVNSADCYYSNISKSGDSLVISFLERPSKENSLTDISILINDRKHILNSQSLDYKNAGGMNFDYSFGSENRSAIGENYYGVIYPFVESDEGNINYKFNLFPLDEEFLLNENEDIKVYIENSLPNKNENINVRIKVLEKTKLNLKLFNINGKLESVLYEDEIQLGEYNFVIPRKDFSSGMKILNCKSEKSFLTKKIIIR